MPMLLEVIWEPLTSVTPTILQLVLMLVTKLQVSADALSKEKVESESNLSSTDDELDLPSSRVISPSLDSH